MILFLIGGAWYFMADIGLRMLTPQELYRANGFPDDYKIDKRLHRQGVRENQASGKVRERSTDTVCHGPGSGKPAGMVRNNNHDHGTAGAAGGRVMERAVKSMSIICIAKGTATIGLTTRGADGQIISQTPARWGA